MTPTIINHRRCACDVPVSRAFWHILFVGNRRQGSCDNERPRHDPPLAEPGSPAPIRGMARGWHDSPARPMIAEHPAVCIFKRSAILTGKRWIAGCVQRSCSASRCFRRPVSNSLIARRRPLRASTNCARVQLGPQVHRHGAIRRIAAPGHSRARASVRRRLGWHRAIGVIGLISAIRAVRRRRCAALPGVARKRRWRGGLRRRFNPKAGSAASRCRAAIIAANGFFGSRAALIFLPALKNVCHCAHHALPAPIPCNTNFR